MNSIPHIGHSFEFILGDAISRFLKKNNIVHFNLGLDEHGLKVYTKSKELGITPEEHITSLTKIWINFCDRFQIEYDTFYKTSTKEHHEKVQKVWNSFLERGDIYKKKYSGKYCVGCESFKSDKELINNNCPDHPGSSLVDVEEENYFFKLSKYKDNLYNWITSNPSFLEPSSKLSELKNLILDSEDISISRIKKNCPWGVTVPNDDEHIIYVWFDALWNYPFSAGYLSDKFNWNNVIQICGPDNLRFQAIIFQAFLESEGIRKSDKLLVHGTILDEDGRKISKTLGNTIDPTSQLEKYGINAVRYYSLCGLTTYFNSNWCENDLINLYNSDICNDWGNLISRVLHLVDIKCKRELIEVDNDFLQIINGYKSEIETLWNDFKIREGLQKTNELVKFLNRYINQEKPWSNYNYGETLSNLYYSLNIVNELYSPVFPDKYIETKIAIENKVKIILFEKLIYN